MSTLDPDARVCACGHTARWHNAIVFGVPPDRSHIERRQGMGECEANKDCECKRFVEDKTDSYVSLRRERDEALKKLEELDTPAPPIIGRVARQAEIAGRLSEDDD
jgi:hypothetical protein